MMIVLVLIIFKQTNHFLGVKYSRDISFSSRSPAGYNDHIADIIFLLCIDWKITQQIFMIFFFPMPPPPKGNHPLAQDWSESADEKLCSLLFLGDNNKRI